MRFVITQVAKIVDIGVMLELKTTDKGTVKAGDLFRCLQREIKCRIKHFGESHINQIDLEFKNEEEAEKTCIVHVGYFKGNYRDLQKGDVLVSGE